MFTRLPCATLYLVAIISLRIMEQSCKEIMGELLFTACKSGDLSAVASLYEQRPEQSQTIINSLLILSAAYNKPTIASYALSNGAKVTTPVMTNIAGASAFETHKVLISTESIDINYYVPWYGDMLSMAVMGDNLDWVRFCLENGADPQLHRVNGYKTTVAAAAERASTGVINLLLQYGCPLKSSGALVFAAEKGRLDVVKDLIAKGADVNEPGPVFEGHERETVEMGTALYRAVANGYKTIVEILLENGADARAKDFKGREPWQLLKSEDLEGIGPLLRTRADEN